MTIRQHIRMTASEIAMGRYMRAPDHSATDFDAAFAEFASPDDKKPDAAAASGDGGAASGGAGDGDGGAAAASAAGGSDTTGGDSGDGGAGAAAGDEGAAAAGGEAGAADAGAEAGKSGDAGAGAGEGAAAGGDAGAAAGGDAGAATGAGAEAGAGAQPAGGADADAILAGLKKLVGQGEAPAAGGEGASTGGQAGEQAQATPIYSDDETAFLKKYEEDWGDVAKGESLKRRAEYQQLLQHIFTQVANFVKPIQETAETLAERTFSTDLKSAVPDYSNQLRDEVTSWVKTQPTYLQVAYNHVINNGTVDEVKDLVDRYRTATGKAKPAGAGGGDPKPAGKGNELSDEAKKAAAALAPVDSKRSGVQAPSDPSNFDDAWKAAAADG